MVVSERPEEEEEEEEEVVVGVVEGVEDAETVMVATLAAGVGVDVAVVAHQLCLKRAKPNLVRVQIQFQTPGTRREGPVG